MADTLTLYTNPQSRGRIARWMLEEVGAPYETIVLGYGTSMKDPSYLAINPMGKVPAIQHGDTVVTECAAVCAYLADAFPQANLAPALSDKARGPYYRWLFFTAGPFEAMVTDKSLGVTVPAEKAGFVGYGTGADILDILEQVVERQRLSAGLALLGGGCVCRRTDQLWAAIWLARKAPGVRGLCSTPCRAPSRDPRQ
ncbi:MAG: glutathione S-transferase N-terminal domain-containing protein [Terricaulis sp.]|nr:glutathione S-transferase N-terminal domain-containing protein [Terricaulis sp.]